MIKKIDHIGIAVRGLEQRLPFWADALGLDVAGIETVDSEGVKVAFLPAGPSRVELLEPTTPDSTVAKFLDRRGEGIHHVTFEVDDLASVVQNLEQRSIPLIGEAPRIGAGGSQIAFVHPKAAGGVLIELVQHPKRRQAEGGEICPGSMVLLYLHEPQEKLWGVLRRLDASGVVLQGLDLASFDDWVAQIERNDEDIVGPSLLFLPMHRVDKILADRPSGNLPSMSQRFIERTGRTVHEVLGVRSPSGD